MGELRKIIAIDFDGCLSAGRWHDLGPPNLEAFRPDIMGKDVFGKKRIDTVMGGVKEKFDYYKKALEYGKTKQERMEKTPEYYQDKMDLALRRILGDEGFVNFEGRYDWLKTIRF